MRAAPVGLVIAVALSLYARHKFDEMGGVVLSPPTGLDQPMVVVPPPTVVTRGQEDPGFLPEPRYTEEPAAPAPSRTRYTNPRSKAAARVPEHPAARLTFEPADPPAGAPVRE